MHELANRTHLLRFPRAHKGTVSAITYAEGPRLLSCGVDRTVKLWDTSVKFGEGELEQEAVSIGSTAKFTHVHSAVSRSPLL